jgi:heterotetrameric sarcosine oxidase delta subunit
MDIGQDQHPSVRWMLPSPGGGLIRGAREAMSFLLTCPNCGVREVTDFGYGGEILPRPKGKPSFRELNTYNYFRVNKAGVQREWWFHRSGCRAWFIAERNTITNEVLFTARPSEVPGQSDPSGQVTVAAGEAEGDLP